MKRVLFVHNQLTRFVRIDRDLLAEGHAVTEHCEASWRTVRPWQLRRAVQAHDLVFCWFASWHSLVPVLWARRLGKPSVVVVGGYDTANVPEAGYGSQRGGLTRVVARQVIASATRLIANSEAAGREAVLNTGADPRKIAVLYHGVDPIAAPEPVNREPLVLTVGNVWRENLRRKGLLPFVQAAAHLPEVRFVLAGRWCDDSIDELRRAAGPNVEFRGFVSDAELGRLYARAAVYVQASLHEGFGLSAAEAMLAGCVPVVTRAGSLPEVVGDAGVYLESQDPRDVARGIWTALGIGAGAAHRARARVQERFTIDRRRLALHALLDDLAAGRPSEDRGPWAGSGHGTAVSGPAAPAVPAVSVIVPCRNEVGHIGVCLRGILALEPPPGGFEVIVADGMSDDGTREMVARLARQDGRLRVIDNPGRIVATGLNAAIRVARGGLIARMDAHTEYAPDYLRECVAALNKTGADNVGGPARTRAERYVQRAVAAAYHSPWSVGGARFHRVGYEGSVDTVPYGCWRKATFDRVGPFDEELVRNQDDEHNLRLVRAGGKVWQSPRIRSWYRPRGSLAALFRQYMQYGYWKVRVIQKHKLPASFRHLVPGLFLAALAVLGCLAPFSRLALGTWLALIATYALAVVGASAATAVRAGVDLFPVLPAVFWCYHFGYGYGFLRGLWDFGLWKRKPARGFTALTRDDGKAAA